MRVLINAMSTTSLAGTHVVRGLIEGLAAQTPATYEWLVIAPCSSPLLASWSQPGIRTIQGPPPSMGWGRRSLWETRHVPRLTRAWDATCVIQTSGVRMVGIGAPQICLACNPRPLVPVPFREPEQRIKHRLQRTMYRWSSARADCTVYNSSYIRNLYEQNGTPRESRALVVPHGLPDRLHAAAAHARSGLGRSGLAERRGVLSVSVWSRYKGVEHLVEALTLLRHRSGRVPRLTLVGPWDSPAFRAQIERRITALGLDGAVRVLGFLSEADLYAEYAKARVFCLPSFTESFGLPALEAQAFGTPVVGSSSTAMAEVCALGGTFCEPGCPAALADHLGRLLSDERRWKRLSAAAARNAQHYRWQRTVRPLVTLLREYETRARAPRRRAAWTSRGGVRAG